MFATKSQFILAVFVRNRSLLFLVGVFTVLTFIARSVCFAEPKDNGKLSSNLEVTPRVFGKLISDKAVVSVQLEGSANHGIDQLWFEYRLNDGEAKKVKVQLKPADNQKFKEIVGFRVDELNANSGSTLSLCLVVQQNQGKSIERSKPMILRIVSEKEVFVALNKHFVKIAALVRQANLQMKETQQKLTKLNSLPQNRQIASVVKPLAKETRSNYLDRQKQFEVATVQLAIFAQALKDNQLDEISQKRLDHTLGELIQLSEQGLGAVCKDLQDAQELKDVSQILATTRRCEEASVGLTKLAESTQSQLDKMASYLEVVQVIYSIQQQQKQR